MVRSSSSPILVVGMPRSGTSLVCEMFGSHADVSLLVEPHALWKTADYHYLDDGDRRPSLLGCNWIKSRLECFAAGKRLVEKSPVNSLRPNRVYAVLPDAHIIYIEREPAACVYSNLKRSEGRDGFKLSLVFKKYLLRTGEKELPNARSYFPIWKQIRFRDALPAFIYTVKMLRLRRQGKLPFGPRLERFESGGWDADWLDYHFKVWERAQEAKQQFDRLYKDRFHIVSLDSLVQSPEVAREMFEGVGLEVSDVFLDVLYQRISGERIHKHNVPDRVRRCFEKV